MGARLRVPLKMTSSIFSPRSDFALCSPRTHAIASDTLLFPHPFGPTIAVMPDSFMAISPLSENDLKPISSIRRSFNTYALFPGLSFYQIPALFVPLSLLAPCDRLGPFDFSKNRRRAKSLSLWEREPRSGG